MTADSCWIVSAVGASVPWFAFSFSLSSASWFFIIIWSCMMALWGHRRHWEHKYHSGNLKTQGSCSCKALWSYLSLSRRACCSCGTELESGGSVMGADKASSCFSMFMFFSFSCSAIAAIFSTSSSAIRRDWRKNPQKSQRWDNESTQTTLQGERLVEKKTHTYTTWQLRFTNYGRQWIQQTK